MPGSEFELRTDDGQSLLARRWLPEGRPRAVVQLAHGLARAAEDEALLVVRHAQHVDERARPLTVVTEVRGVGDVVVRALRGGARVDG